MSVGFVTSEVFLFLMQHSWYRINAKVKPSAATGYRHITSRSGFLFPSYLVMNVDCLLWLQSLYVCGWVCVVVCLVLKSTSACVLDKNTT